MEEMERIGLDGGGMLFFIEELTTPMVVQSLLMLDFCSLQIFVAFSMDVLNISDGYFLSLHKVI